MRPEKAIDCYSDFKMFLEGNPAVPRSTLLSAEAHFHSTGYVKKQYCCIVRPFFDDTLVDDRYGKVLKEEFSSLFPRNLCQFQIQFSLQDGARPHCELCAGYVFVHFDDRVFFLNCLDMESLGHHTLKILAHAYYYYRIF
jgi:hypothetical protein